MTTIEGARSMKAVMIAAILGGQAMIAAQPALAAELTDGRTQQMGAFAGLRMRMPLDGTAQQRRIRAGLTLAPTMHSRSADGAVRMRMGEGLELGLSGDSPVRLSIAGTPVSRLAQGPAAPDGAKAGISTLGWVAISVGVIAVTVFALGQLCVDGEICGSE